MESDWKIIQKELIFRNPWIELYQDKVETRTGKVMDYTWYKSSDVAVIVPFVEKDNNLVMIRQYRYPLRKVLLEFPAGHIENGEDATKSAKRELLEETGYLLTKSTIYTYYPSVSKSRQLVYIFKATDPIEEKANHNGAEDIIRTEIVSVEELKHLIKQRRIESAGTLLAYLICCSGILS